jgi:hypothetical protein
MLKLSTSADNSGNRKLKAAKRGSSMSPEVGPASVHNRTSQSCYRVSEKLKRELIVLRPGQSQLAPIKEIPPRPAALFQSPGIQLEPDFEFVIAQGDRIPNDEGPFSFELKTEINAGGSTVLDREAPHSVQL